MFWLRYKIFFCYALFTKCLVYRPMSGGCGVCVCGGGGVLSLFIAT